MKKIICLLMLLEYQWILIKINDKYNDDNSDFLIKFMPIAMILALG